MKIWKCTFCDLTEECKLDEKIRYEFKPIIIKRKELCKCGNIMILITDEPIRTYNNWD